MSQLLTQIAGTLSLQGLFSPASIPSPDLCSALTLPASISGFTTLTTSTYYASGDLVNLTSYNGAILSSSLSSFCRVELTITTNAESGSTAKTELWLPDEWNGRILGVGNGGFSGGIVYSNLAQEGLRSSFASFSTNTGHNSSSLDGSWALNNPDSIIDFSWRSIHLSSVVSKVITSKYYNTSKRKIKSYFSGCSTGGAQGLKAAQEWPEDFDGILVGSPASHMTHLQAWALRQNRAVSKAEPPIDKKIWALVHQEVLNQCDHLDGIVDGVLQDPRACHFRPENLACRPKQWSPCLTQSQIQAVKTIYSDYVDIDDNFIFSRSEPGGELSYHLGALGTSPIAFPLQYYKYFVMNDTNWDHRTLTRELMQSTDELDVGQLNAINLNLLPFAKKNGKLIHYFGWGDQNISPQDSIKYHDSVHLHTNLHSTLSPSSFYRLFPVPGMAHCTGGEGPNAFGATSQAASSFPPFAPSPKYDILLALVDWVENGNAPEEVVAVKWGKEGEVVRRRKLCVYPKRSVWNGQDETKEDNFECLL